MNRNVPPNRGHIFKPGEDNDGWNPYFSKTSSRKGMGNNVEEFLSINSKTNSGLLLGSKLLRSKSNTQESLLSLAIRNTSDRARMDIGTSVGAKDEKGSAALGLWLNDLTRIPSSPSEEAWVFVDDRLLFHEVNEQGCTLQDKFDLTCQWDASWVFNTRPKTVCFRFGRLLLDVYWPDDSLLRLRNTPFT